MQGYIDKSKLFFIQKLVSSSPNFIHKQLFIKRLFKFLYTGSHQSRGYIPDVFEILDRYGLKDCLLRDADTGEFPEEQLWKKPVRESIHLHQMRDWRSGIDSKPELEIYGEVHQALEPLVWWETAMRNSRALAEISNAINVLNGNVPSLLMEKVRDVGDSFK